MLFVTMFPTSTHLNDLTHPHYRGTLVPALNRPANLW